jgi:hypothetical protein
MSIGSPAEGLLPWGWDQSWARDVIDILREAHHAAEEALARGDPVLDAELLVTRPVAGRKVLCMSQVLMPLPEAGHVWPSPVLRQVTSTFA